MPECVSTAVPFPRHRPDLIISVQDAGRERQHVVKDPVTGRFFRFRETEAFILRQFDGATSLEVVRERVRARLGTLVSLATLEQFVGKLQTLGLLLPDSAAAPAAPLPRRRIRGNPLYLRFPAFDPDQLLDWLAGRLGVLFTPGFVAGSAALVALAVGLTLTTWPEIIADFARLWNFRSLAVAWLVIFLVIGAHEFAHGLTCKHFGGQVHEMGFMLLYLQPAFYCNVSDAWLFPQRSQRLWVTLAGAYCELVIWAGATVVWRLTAAETALNYLALVVMATSGIKSLFNLNPLIKLDGYYLLSDWLEIPNLRQKAFRYLGQVLCRPLGRAMTTAQNLTRRERRIYLSYGLLAGVYSYWLIGMVVWWLGGLLVRHYQGWGAALLAGLLAIIFGRPLRLGFARMLSVFMLRQGLGTRVKKLAVTVIASAGVGLVLAVVPMELKVAGEFHIRPIDNADVRVEIDGLIMEVVVEEGATVQRGDVIARLSARDYTAELREVRAAIDEKLARLRMLKAGPRREEIELARTTVQKGEERLRYGISKRDMLETLFKQNLVSRKEFDEAEEEVAVRGKELEESQGRLQVLLAGSRPEEIEALEAEVERLAVRRAYLEDQLARVTLVSPIAGVITTRKLKDKVGQHVRQGDLIAEVHFLDVVTAEIAISEKEIADVRVGQPVVLKARAYPGRNFRGEVTAIAPVAREPEEGLPVRTILVVTEFANPGHLLKPEMTGHAKISCGQRPLLELLTRRLVRYLKVEFWSWW